MQGRLTGKVALVTGAGSGMGRAGSVAMAAEGAAVAVADLNGESADRVSTSILKAGGRAMPFAFDVTHEREVIAAVDAIHSEFGKLDILYTCAIDSADVSQNDGKLIDLDLTTLRRIIDVNLFGALICAKHVGIRMVAQGGGAIIFSGTVDGLVGCSGLDAYTAAKGGLMAVTRSLAAGLGAHGVRVNSVCPGFVMTEAHESWLHDTAAVAAVQRLHILTVPAAEDIAPLVVYLASDEARCVTGAVWPIDAGYSAFKVRESDIKEILESHQ
jgi:NAD(P)-dependent dehydrogenase (short-subunit alcohol dehydrogenase family)